MVYYYRVSILLALTYLTVSVLPNRRRIRRHGKPQYIRDGTGVGLGDCTNNEKEKTFQYMDDDGTL